MKDIKYFLIEKKSNSDSIANLIEEWWDKNDVDKIIDSYSNSQKKQFEIKTDTPQEKIDTPQEKIFQKEIESSIENLEPNVKSKKSKSKTKKGTLDEMIKSKGGY
jgi:hypothetical protein